MGRRTCQRPTPWDLVILMSASRSRNLTSLVSLAVVSWRLDGAYWPVFSTRTILRNRDPWWEEEAFSKLDIPLPHWAELKSVLVTGDAIEAGERLRLRICDSDRFSADDAMGKVEVELADLVERGKASSSEKLDRRADELQAERPGMRTSGILHWSVKFHGMWAMAPDEVHQRLLARKSNVKGEPEDVVTPWWMEQIKKFVGEAPVWAEDRKQRRKEAVAWITGEKEKDELEASEAPSPELRSGVIQFHIHQCVGKLTLGNIS